eukprot:scaffold18906_cov122-Isochrysis_galbana.AAC.1
MRAAAEQTRGGEQREAGVRKKLECRVEDYHVVRPRRIHPRLRTQPGGARSANGARAGFCGRSLLRDCFEADGVEARSGEGRGLVVCSRTIDHAARDVDAAIARRRSAGGTQERKEQPRPTAHVQEGPGPPAPVDA